jgi:predicted short-subunit dehydrogenase-like oxidoreductase (DUF2520 family)
MAAPGAPLARPLSPEPLHRASAVDPPRLLGAPRVAGTHRHGRGGRGDRVAARRVLGAAGRALRMLGSRRDELFEAVAALRALELVYGHGPIVVRSTDSGWCLEPRKLRLPGGGIALVYWVLAATSDGADRSRFDGSTIGNTVRLVSPMRELERDRRQTLDAGAFGARIAVVGPGRVGRSLARAAADAGLDVSVAGRRDALVACERAEVALLCVPDEAISEACETVADAIPPLRFVGHVSGATPLAALDTARRRGAQTFCLHPLQTIPDGSTRLVGSPCAVTASGAEAHGMAAALGERLGMRPFPLADEQRTVYHAAASMASNFLVALQESAAALLERAGVEDGRELLAPLVLRTAANWAELGEEALTGPIARGDQTTVDRHLEAIEEAHPELVDLYRALAERTRELAGRPEIVA